MVALAFAVAASANLPALLFNLFWRRFNTLGATFSIYVGLICAVVLVFFSPVVSGTPTSLAPNLDFAWLPPTCQRLSGLYRAETLTSRPLAPAN